MDADNVTEFDNVPVATRSRHVPKLDRRQRIWSAAMGSSFIGLLLIAGVLKPNVDGLGTHRQLGLPPCTTVALFGVPCPTCGMTTSWSHFMRGEWSQSWAANPGGMCLAILSAIAGVWSIKNATLGVYRPWITHQVGFAIAIAITAITLIDWTSRIF